MIGAIEEHLSRDVASQLENDIKLKNEAAVKVSTYYSASLNTFFSTAPTPSGPIQDPIPPRPTHRLFTFEQKKARFSGRAAGTRSSSSGRKSHNNKRHDRNVSAWQFHDFRNQAMDTVEDFFCRDLAIENSHGENNEIPRVDPYAGWWNGKVSLYWFMKRNICQIVVPKNHKKVQSNQGEESMFPIETSPSDISDSKDTTEFPLLFEKNYVPRNPKSDNMYCSDLYDHSDVSFAPQGSNLGAARVKSNSNSNQHRTSILDAELFNGSIRMQLHLDSRIIYLCVLLFVLHYIYLLSRICRKKENRIEYEERVDPLMMEIAVEEELKTSPERRFGHGYHAELGAGNDRHDEKHKLPPPSIIHSAFSLLEDDSQGDGEEYDELDDEWHHGVEDNVFYAANKTQRKKNDVKEDLVGFVVNGN